MNIKVLVDTSCGISKNEIEKMGYEMIPLPFLIDENEYDDYNISFDDFYAKIKTANNIKTSQASLEVLQNKIDEMLKSCDHILYFPITSGLSSSYSTAVSILGNDEKYEGKVTIIDHSTISVVERAMLHDVQKLIDKNVEPSKIKELIEKNNKNNSVYIAVDNLDYLKKGGRINPLVATVGNILNIKPILYSDGGKFDIVKKVRSLKAIEDSMAELVSNDIKNKFKELDINKYEIGVAYTGIKDEGIKYANEMKNKFSCDILLDELPMVIGCHIGEGAIALAIYKKLDEC